MAKDVDGYSETKGAHGDQRNKVHKRHTSEAKKRDFEQLLASYEILEEFCDYPPFKSKLLELGEGNNWVRKDGKLEELDGEDWLCTMYELATDNEWYHVRCENKTKVYYKKRKMRDRETLSPNDRKQRPKTDLGRYTIDLRPDHSRAIQKLLACGKKREARELADKARDECIRLFEHRYHRDVRAVGEHTDSGQLHFDLWHTGICEVEVSDSRADVIGGKVVNGHKMVIRERTEYKAYGVGVGVASWDRHRRAIRDAGIKPDSLMNKDTLETITKMSALKKEETKEPPRDIAVYESLDRFMALELSAVAQVITKEALTEYVDWLSTGYQTEKLGKRELTQREKKMASKIKQLRGIEETLTQELQQANFAISRLRGLLELTRQFLESLRAKKDLLESITKAGLKKAFDTCLSYFAPAALDETNTVTPIPEVAATQKVNHDSVKPKRSGNNKTDDAIPKEMD